MAPLAGMAVMTLSFSPPVKTFVIPETAAEHKIVLVVDAGHGGNDAGASYGTLKEKDLNLRVAKRLGELSSAYNIEVHLTRTNDEDVSLTKRAEMTNQLKADDFISVHVNDGKSTNGHYLAIDARGKKAKGSTMLSNAVMNQLTTLDAGKPGGKTYSVRTDLHLAVLKSNAASVLIELGDINNESDMARLTNASQLDELCNAILTGVVEAHKR